MKVLYNQIKELVPGLKAGPREVGETLALAGFMMESLTEVSFKGAKDYLIGFEVRQNRADCLSVYGLAKEAAACYGLKVKLPKLKTIAKTGNQLDIKVEAVKIVKRITAIKITGLKNQESPAWLKEFVGFQGINSVNLLVDLSNYVMFLTGYPSHLIDLKKVSGRISWSLNHEFNQVTTLLGTTVNLKKDNELIIRDQKNIIALSLVGSRAAEIDEATDSVIAEVAVYDRVVIRNNSRSLNIVTEASHRLEKELDPNGCLEALKLLSSLILEYAGGRAESRLFDYYPKKYISPVIKFDPESPSRFAGIEISKKDALKIFKDLNFNLKKSSSQFLVTPPTYRQDLALPEDLVEEVIRIYGYDKIPATEVPKLEVAPDITPQNIILAEKIRDTLTVLGFDEILSWPLTKRGDNELVNYLDWRTVATQNSFNYLFPDLRQSIMTGLLNQLNEYIKKNVDLINIFEIGKNFGEKNGKYLEEESLGIMSAALAAGLPGFKNKVELLLAQAGFNGIEYNPAEARPKISNPNSCWDIYYQGDRLGIIYKAAAPETKLNVYFAEISLTKITGRLAKVKNNPVVEITKKLITLDANVELDKSRSIVEYLKDVKKKFNQEHVWSLVIADAYPLDKSIRYTVRATYMELSDQEAKKIHLQAFGLNI